MDELITATGRRFDCDYFVPFYPVSQVDIDILNMPLIDVVTIFNNPAETSQLWYGNEYLSGYTNLISITPRTRAVRITLQKDYSN